MTRNSSEIQKKWELEKKINHSILRHDVTDFISNATDEDMILDLEKAEEFLTDMINEYKGLLAEVKGFSA